MANPDVIEFEEEGGSRFPIGGIAGALAGALIGYKFAKQTFSTPTPQPLPNNVIIANGEEGTDTIELALTTGVFAAVGYALGSMISRATPRRFRLRHKD